MIFTWFDAVLLGVMLISALLALMRGFTREVLSILSWVGAAIVARVLYPVLRDTARTYFAEGEEWVADIVLISLVFLIVLVIISVITMRISDWILDSGVGVLDRTIGFLFGLARGLLLVVVAYLFVLWWEPPEKHPDGIRNARTLPIVNQTADIIIYNMPTEIAEVLFSKILRRGTDDVQQPSDTPTNNDASQTDTPTQEGYNGNERSGLNQLLESTQDNQN